MLAQSHVNYWRTLIKSLALLHESHQSWTGSDYIWTNYPGQWKLSTLHMWIPLLNQYRSYRQISTIDEIDCPNPKRFNSLLTQNLFLIWERILSTNWCLDATFPVDLKCPWCLKKNILKTNKLKSDFQLWTKTPWTPRKKNTLDIENSRGYPTPAEFPPWLGNQCNNFQSIGPLGRCFL